MELAPIGAGGIFIAAIGLAWLFRRRSVTGFAGRAGREYQVLPPPDHDRPAAAMLAGIARSTFPAASGPGLFMGAGPAAFGRSVRISARRISYRDYAGGAWAEAHPARLEHLYPGIQVIPAKEEPC